MNAAAHNAYLDQYSTVQHKIDKVKIMLETHAMREANDKGNWGFSGDLHRIDKLLDEILNEEK